MRYLILSLLTFSCLASAGPDDLAYFQQFQYREVNQEKDPDFPPRMIYYFFGSDFDFRVDYGQDQFLIVTISVFLNADQTYDIVYRDGVGQKSSPNQWMPRQCLEMRGRWAVPDKTLLLYNEQGEPILEGARLFKDGQNAANVKVLSAFEVPELRGASSPFFIVQDQGDKPARICQFP
jgi:hypothetical protein